MDERDCSWIWMSETARGYEWVRLLASMDERDCGYGWSRLLVGIDERDCSRVWMSETARGYGWARLLTGMDERDCSRVWMSETAREYGWARLRVWMIESRTNIVRYKRSRLGFVYCADRDFESQRNIVLMIETGIRACMIERRRNLVYRLLRLGCVHRWSRAEAKVKVSMIARLGSSCMDDWDRT